MVFTALFFLFFFLILGMAWFYTRKTLRGQNAVLLALSLCFYAWNGPAMLLLLCGMTFICWLAGRVLGRIRIPFYRRAILFLTVSFCLLIFAFWGYADLFATALRALFRTDFPIPKILLPFGISFYTLRLLSYVADVYHEEVQPQKRYTTLLLYAALFHLSVAGPVVRYGDICAELQDRRLRLSDVSAGITRFSVGLAKAAILANKSGALADTALSADSLASASSGTVFLGTVFFMLRIYLDLSAYADMAIGLGLACGLHYPENFRYPYCADSIADFWRRWNSSVSAFFRDYVYVPLGGNRHELPKQIRNLLIHFLLMGLWYGASWNCLFWGLYCFALLLGENLIPHTPYADLSLPRKILRRCGLLTAIWFGWILFRFDDIRMLGNALACLFFRNGFWDAAALQMLGTNLFFLIVAIAACTPILPILTDKIRAAAAVTPAWQGLVRAISVAAPAVLLLLSFLALVGTPTSSVPLFRFSV